MREISIFKSDTITGWKSISLVSLEYQSISDFNVLASITWLGAQENMKVIITEHAKKRLNNLRQDKITTEDIINAAHEIPAHVPSAARFRGFFARSGRMFDLVVKDISAGRLVITIIGKRSPKK